VRHEVWQVPAHDNPAVVEAFATVEALYIADGHHRAASAARTRKSLASKGAGEHDRVLAVAFPDNQVQVLPYNRVVKDLNGMTPDAFLAALERTMPLRKGVSPTPMQKGQVEMYLSGEWHTLHLKTAANGLDVDVLETDILQPLLGITDVRTDKRIDFVGGIRGTEGRAAHEFRRRRRGVFLYPVSVKDLMRVSDAGGIMPPKSTWFEPAARWLLSHLIQRIEGISCGCSSRPVRCVEGRRMRSDVRAGGVRRLALAAIKKTEACARRGRPKSPKR
jgi:uncharacterized protein (DUF1015 family)